MDHTKERNVDDQGRTQISFSSHKRQKDLMLLTISKLENQEIIYSCALDRGEWESIIKQGNMAMMRSGSFLLPDYQQHDNLLKKSYAPNARAEGSPGEDPEEDLEVNDIAEFLRIRSKQ